MKCVDIANKEKKKDPTIPFKWKCIFGGCSGCVSTILVQPADLLKTRMQLEKRTKMTTFQTASRIVRNKGFVGLYQGVSAAMLRQMMYSSVRFGCFNEAIDIYKAEHGHLPNLRLKLALSMTTGIIGASVACPIEVPLIRMTSDGRMPMDKRKNYKHVFDCIIRIIREEGARALTKGVVPTVTRSVLLNVSQLSAYTETREKLLPLMNDTPALHFASSLVAGLVATFSTQPVDIVKTRMQNSRGNQSPLLIFKTIIQKQGIFSLWSGFTPTYCKIAPHTIITFMILEQLNAYYLRHYV